MQDSGTLSLWTVFECSVVMVRSATTSWWKVIRDVVVLFRSGFVTWGMYVDLFHLLGQACTMHVGSVCS
jgi:hypothetical protein